MKNKLYWLSAGCMLSLAFCASSLCTSCAASDEPLSDVERGDAMTFQIEHPDQQVAARATSTAFEENDQIGLFITDAKLPLEPSGNYVNNASLSYAAGKWTPARPIYWNQGTYNVFAYYPYKQAVSSVDDYPFEVALDQRQAGYTNSDFLWAKNEQATASAGAVALKFKHCMSRLLIRLVRGADYEGELPASAEVYVHNTVPAATVDMSVGVVTRNRYAASQTITAKSLGNHNYTAILVPQRLDNRVPLVEVVMNGVSYLYESKFLFKPGIQHTVSLVVSKNPEQLKIEIGGELEQWS